MRITVMQAYEKVCPQRFTATTALSRACLGDSCMAWKWDAEFEFITTKCEKVGEEDSIKYVPLRPEGEGWTLRTDLRQAFNYFGAPAFWVRKIPDESRVGYCGLTDLNVHVECGDN